MSTVQPNTDNRKPKTVVHFLLAHDPEKGWAKPQTKEWKKSIVELLQNEIAGDKTSPVYFNMKEVWDSNVEDADYQNSLNPSTHEGNFTFRYQFLESIQDMNSAKIVNEIKRILSYRQHLLTKLMSKSPLPPKEEEELFAELGRVIFQLHALSEKVAELGLSGLGSETLI